MSIAKKARGLALIPAALLLAYPGSPANSAEFEGELRFGMSTALSGPAADLGINMRSGILAAFEETNRVGGIHGRRLRLLALDDGYEPARTAPNMRKLVADPEILGVIGNVGTPTAISAIPIANESRIVFFGAFTGAGVLRRQPPDRYVINYRASYAEETAAMVDALINVARIRPEEIAFFTQRDSYGDSGYRGGIEALKRHGLRNEHDIAHGRYERNTTSIEDGLADIFQAEPLPKAVIMVGAYAPCANFIRLARQSGLDAIFANVSFVGSASLARQLQQDGDGVIITQVVPHFESDLPAVQEFRAALAELDRSLRPTFGALEGYVSARILIRALQGLTPPITRESVVDGLEELDDFDLGLGTPLALTENSHQASHRVWPTVIRGGELVPFEWHEIKSKPAKRK